MIEDDLLVEFGEIAGHVGADRRGNPPGRKAAISICVSAVAGSVARSDGGRIENERAVARLRVD